MNKAHSGRDEKIDVYKGILVFGMILCHILQFFVDLGNNPEADYVTWYINAVTFSGFVFTFGYTSELAYFTKEFKVVYRKMLMVLIRLMLAFYISGMAFRIFVTNQRLSYIMVKQIVLLQDIPGWSEFILSFALYIFIAIIGFKPIKKLVDNKKLFWIVVGGLLLTTLFPYEKVSYTQLGLIFGSTKFAAFPVVQYMPFYLIGIYFKRYEIGYDRKILMGSVLSSLIGLLYIFNNEMMLPSRFPPSVFWILLPCGVLYGYLFLSKSLVPFEAIKRPLSVMGQNSILYLLLSNIIIFALASTRGLAQLNLWTGLIANLLLILVITFILSMVRPTGMRGVV